MQHEPDRTGPHLEPAEFERLGSEALRWITNYLDRAETLPVASRVEPGDIRRSFPAAPPETGTSLDDLFEVMDEKVVPGLTHWQSPNWFAYFPCNHSFPSILGELLAAGLGTQGMIWATSPACTELESLMMDWALDAFGLPDRFRTGARDGDGSSDCIGGGVIQDTASSATFCALLAARERATDGVAGRDGVSACPPLVAYTSEHAHSSVEKACGMAGLGRANLRLVPSDPETLAMRPDELERLMDEDAAAGRIPFYVCTTCGTTSSGAIDDTAAISEITRKHGAWLHLDGAMFGVAAICPEFRWVLAGAEHCDSVCVNPHKWLFTNFDCDLFWVADRQALTRALGIMPEYLRNAPSESGKVIDYRDWQVPLGRRFRALKLWLVFRHYGLEGLRTALREHIAIAQEFADMIDADPDWIRCAPSPLSLICIRHRDGDERTQAVLEAINASGEALLSHTKFDDHYVIRVSIGQTRTRLEHVHKLFELLGMHGRG
ncbi:MAG: pyridoxal-dependent decarboxylase [Phycisphaerales bacterium]|nr:pyridoxal-dependent decarboxylase [Phycisphaerales bacterium]